ncbi:MAG: PIN domain-containing protein [Rhizonema sp. PD37]|nr:PIN domain-containing protein [Rhizonema sp. PD37]
MILYIETNFLMSIAKGQDLQAEYLLKNTPNSVRLAMPSLCFAEALTTLEQEGKYSRDFLNKLDMQISEAERDKSSENARLLFLQLEQSKISFFERMNDIKKRFDDSFNKLFILAEIIELTSEILEESSIINLLEKHIVDKFILACIIYHARLHPSEKKIFLSSNSKEFGQREVIDLLQNAGIRYFNKTQNFLGWLQSQ